MKYICMKCGKTYEDKNVPVISYGEGCCTVSSLIKVDYEAMDRLHEAYEDLMFGKITLWQYLKIYKNLEK